MYGTSRCRGTHSNDREECCTIPKATYVTVRDLHRILHEHSRILVTGWAVDIIFLFTVPCTEYLLEDGYPLPFNHQAM